MFTISLAKDQRIIRKQKMRQSVLHYFLIPPKKLDKSTLFTVANIILLRVSITTTKIRGDNGSPGRKPCELLKKLEGDPFIKMENRTVDIQNAIQAHHFSPKPFLFNK
jgi:hypothetical protein